MMLIWRALLALFLGGMIISAPVQAEIYRCVSPEGKVTFQDKRCVGAESVEVKQSSATDGKTFLWQIDTGKARMYMLGSIHFGVPEMYPLPRVMESAFDESDVLVVEMDSLNADQQKMAELVSANGLYQDGSTLQDHLTPSTWRDLKQASANMGVDVKLFLNQKPWLVSLSLSVAMIQRLGLRQDLGLDYYFLNRASRLSKRIVELEGMQYQLELFNQLSAAEQEVMLQQALADLGQGQAFVDEMLAAWNGGDTKAMEALFNEGLVDDEVGKKFNQIIMIDRNYRMVEKMVKMLQIPGTYFVVVGAGHLVGDEGLVQLMSARGYTVRRR